jgi:hypothetical protein
VLDGSSRNFILPDPSGLTQLAVYGTGSGFEYVMVGVGGIAGFLYDTAVNTYYAGEIRINGQSGKNIEFDRQLASGSDYSNNWRIAEASGSGAYNTEGYYNNEYDVYYTDNNLTFSTNNYGSRLAIGRLFGWVGMSQTPLHADNAIGRDICQAPASPYDIATSGLYSDCLGFNTIFLDGYTAVDSSSGLSHTLRGYKVANNFATTSAGNFPLAPSSTVWTTGYSDASNHVRTSASPADLLNDLSSGLGLVAQMTEIDLKALSTDPATQQALVSFGQSLISGWTLVGGEPVLTVLAQSSQPLSRPCAPSVGGGAHGEMVIPGVPNTGRR